MATTNARIWASVDPFLEAGSIWGRKVANEQFLHALFQQNPFEAYHFFLKTPRQIRDFKQLLGKSFPEMIKDNSVRIFLRSKLPDALRAWSYHCFHLSDCINHPPVLARLRNTHAKQLFPITSVTHSLSYPEYPAHFLAHLWPGCTPRDCIIATSTAGKNVVLEYFSVLSQRYDISKEQFPAPEVAVIPLGMRDSMDRTRRETLRHQQRASLQASQATCVLLILGRIAPHSKMDLLPMLRAWQRISADCSQDVLLVVAGWTEPDDDFPKTFAALARNVGLSCHIEARPSDHRKQELYAAADIFLSLADNVQETFGLTLLEASLAQLPVIAADYSGYRDIIQHGVTGYLIPTLGPEASEEINTLAGLIPDYEVQFLLAQQTAVDTPILADTLRALIRDPNLRQSLGQAGRERILAMYSWPVVINQYLDLWEKLNKRAVDCGREYNVPRPLEPAYAQVFRHFTSSSLKPSDRIVCSKVGKKIYADQDFPVIYAGLEDMIDIKTLKSILFFARKPRTIAEIHQKMNALSPPPVRHVLHFCLHWSLKHDLLEIVRNV